MRPISQPQQTIKQNPLLQILNKDSQISKDRQKQLFYNKLNIDENKPINQYIIRSKHFLEDDNEEVFLEFCKNIAYLSPNQEINLLLKQYLEIQKNIDVAREGLYQLEVQLTNDNDKKRKEIQEINKKLIELKPKRDQNYQKCQILKAEVQKHQQFIDENAKYLKNEKLYEQEFQKTVQRLDNNYKEMLKKTQQKFNQIEEQINELFKIDEKHQQLGKSLTQSKKDYSGLQVQFNTLNPVNLQAEIELEQLQQKIKRQKLEIKFMEEWQNKMKEQNVQKSNMEENRESQNSLPSRISRIQEVQNPQNYGIAQQKIYLKINKSKESFQWFWWLLLVVTAGLTVITFRSVF